MATTEKLLVSGTLDTVLNTGASLANNSLAVATYTPTDQNYPLWEVQLNATFSVAPTAGTGFSVWFLRSLDGGSTYEDGDATTTPGKSPDLVLPLRAVTTAQQVTRVVAAPPGSPKVLAKNDGTGQSASSGWTLKIRPVTRQAV